MADEIKDVNSVEPSTTEQVVTPADTTQQTDTNSTTEVTQTPPVVGEPQVEAVDEFGVPYKNRAMEWKRKTEELADRLPNLIQEAVSTSFGKQQTQPQYTVEQLESFASQTDNPAYATWAKQEIRKLEKEENAKVVRAELEKFQKAQTDEIKRQQSYQYVARNYPEAFVKDNNGRIVGWNNKHPLTQTIGQLMNDPRLKNDPEALTIASDLAYARYIKTVAPQMQKKETELKREVKDLQRKTLVEGGGKTTIATPEHVEAINRLKKTGSMSDAREAMRAIMKARNSQNEE